MSQLSGLLSLFFIAAAFLTTCDGVEQTAGMREIPGMPSLAYDEE